MFKKIGLIVVTVMAMVLMSGCNLKEKIGESITEKIIEQATDGEVDVDINGGDVTYSTDDGEVKMDDENGLTIEGEDGTVLTSGGDYEWPTDQAATYLPKLEVGTIIYILNGPDSCMIMAEGIVLDDYKSYKEAIIDAGFTNDKFDSSAEDMELYTGTSSDGVVATVSFIASESTIQVTLDASAKQ